MTEETTITEACAPSGPRIELHYGDCITGMAEKLAPESVHLVVTSPPFEELFSYSGKPEDVGNNGSTIDIRSGRFALNLRFVIEQAFRVLAPGCARKVSRSPHTRKDGFGQLYGRVSNCEIASSMVFWHGSAKDHVCS